MTVWYYVVFEPGCQSNAFSDNYEQFIRFVTLRRILIETCFGAESWRNGIFFHRDDPHSGKDSGGIGVFLCEDERFDQLYSYIAERFRVLLTFDNYIISTCTNGVPDSDEIYYTQEEIDIGNPYEYGSRHGAPWKSKDEYLYCAMNDLAQRLDFINQVSPLLKICTEVQRSSIEAFASRFLEYLMVFSIEESESRAQEIIEKVFGDRLDDLIEAYHNSGLIDERNCMRDALDFVLTPLPFDDEQVGVSEYNDILFMRSLSDHLARCEKRRLI